MSNTILTYNTASITELKKSPMNTVESAGGQSIAILNRNEPVFYCVPSRLYNSMMEMLDDNELAYLAQERSNGPFTQVDLDDL
ncbi:MAG: type II toxin-antitoxin system Phd/YefM family antitoxin [Janthinobacterium lividum]